MHRRTFLKTSSAAVATLAAPAIVSAQAAWPNKLVKLILPYPPGGSTDLIGRPWAELLSALALGSRNGSVATKLP